MTDWYPRHRRSKRLPMLVRLGAAVVVPTVGAFGLVAVLDEDASEPSDVLHAQVETPDEASQSSVAAKASADPNAPASEPSAADPAAGGGAANAADAGSGRPAGVEDRPSPAGDSGADESDSSAPSSPPSGDRTPNEPRPSDEPERPETPGTPDAPEPPDTPGTPPSDPPPPLEPPERPEPEPGPAPEPAPPSLTSYEAALLDAANSARNRAGCPDLRVDARLTAAARSHSVDMRDRRFFSHINPDGESPSDRAADAGYRGAVGENLSYGLRSASLVIATWSLFPSDRSTLLDCGYTAAGVGVELGRLGAWWTLKFGRG